MTSARELARRIRAREISAREVMTAHLERINRINPTLNAIVGRPDDETCLALADEADRQLARGADVGPLHGLPFAFKDLEAAAGLPFTRGSPIFADDRPSEDSILVARLRRAGVIPIGKTNVPEFGMGSHTYNKVYGATRNPYDPSKSAGGSSGGAAVAVATDMVPVADGSDLGGSLRNPGSFNNVVGFRPTFGLVPAGPTPIPNVGFGVKGPIGRSVDDVVFLLGVMADADVAGLLGRDFEGVRIAWCPDLGGLPVDRRVRSVIDRQRSTFESLGASVEDACPDFALADSVFLTIRAWMSHYAYAPLLSEHRDLMKPEAIWEIERGARLSGHDVARAFADQGELLDRMRRFQQQYEFLVCTVNQVPPFDVAVDWPKEIEGVRMEHYVAWMKSTYWISATLCPAISMPAGFTDEGLPVGVQIVGRRGDDRGVLQLARAFEEITGFGRTEPALVLSGAGTR
jgi:amidase